MTALIFLMDQAREAGLAIDQESEDRLLIRGGRRHEDLMRQLLARKPDVLSLVEIYNGRRARLDWSNTKVGEQPAPCVLCGHGALLRDPYDRVPCHKTCAETLLSPGVPARGSLGEQPVAA